MAYVNFLEPHMPFTGPRDDQYSLDYVDLPANFDAVPGRNDHLKARMLHAAYRHNGFGGVALDTEAGWRRLIANYWGLVSQVDAAVGTILETLSACGLDENTVVVYTSDHGDMMGSHRLLAKTVMYEEAVTTPLLIKAPGLKPRRESYPVSQIDLAPTLVDLLGGVALGDVQGQSLRPLLETGRLPAPREVFIEWSGPDGGVSKLEKGETMPDYVAGLGSREELVKALRDPVRAVITPDRWKLCYSPWLGEHALYDLNDDQYELSNLYGAPGHQARVDDMKRRLAAWGVRSGDDVAAGI